MATASTINASFERIDDADRDADSNEDAREKELLPSWRWLKSGTEMHGDFIGYVTLSGERIAELFLSIAFFYFGRQIPVWFDALYGDDVSAPYQVTGNGDVIIDLGLNFPLLSQTVPISMLTLVFGATFPG